MMPERRRWRDVDGARFDAARRLALAAWPLIASLAAVALLVAATVVSVRAIRDRDRLEALAREVSRSADASTEASEGNRALLEQAKPCLTGDPPESPACERKALADAYVASILTSLATGIAAHDANTSAQHDALRRRLGVTSPLPASSPITAAPRPAPTASTTTTRPTTTTTSCPRLPNGRCRP